MLPTPIAINVTRVVTGLCFGALAAALVLVMARLLPAALQATGQTMVQAATFGLGSAAGAIVGGVLYGAFGPTAFFAFSGVLVILGGIGTWLVLYGPVGARILTDRADRAPRAAGGSRLPGFRWVACPRGGRCRRSSLGPPGAPFHLRPCSTWGCRFTEMRERAPSDGPALARGGADP